MAQICYLVDRQLGVGHRETGSLALVQNLVSMTQEWLVQKICETAVSSFGNSAIQFFYTMERIYIFKRLKF